MKRTTLPTMAFLACGVFATSGHADIMGFFGPWDPVDLSGNLINGYFPSFQQDGESFNASLSSDHSTLTLDFVNPIGGSSIFSNYADPSILPTGIVSYNWSVDFLQDATWLMETDVFTTFPGGDNFGFLTAGTYTGTASLNYTSGDYFSFGNIGFRDGAHEAILTLSNFQYSGPATVLPEPGTIFIFSGGLLGIALVRGRPRLSARK